MSFPVSPPQHLEDSGFTASTQMEECHRESTEDGRVTNPGKDHISQLGKLGNFWDIRGAFQITFQTTIIANQLPVVTYRTIVFRT